MAKIRAVFDCNMFVQALFNPKGFAMKCFEAVKVGKIMLFVSSEILLEIRDVLQRPNLISRFPNTSVEQIEIFLEEVLFFAVEIENVPPKFRYERDPDDEPYINLAVEVKADFIVSRDRDLLDLMTDFAIEAKEFRQRFRPLKVVEPKEFLQIIEAKEI